MTLKQWLDNRWLVEHSPTAEEIAALLDLADRDLRDARVTALSPDWRLAIAYNAALQVAVAALAASGYRPGRGGSHHYYSIESLQFTLGLDLDTVRVLDAFRKKRNIADYERAGTVTTTEVDELLSIAEELRDKLVAWLRTRSPTLLRP